MKLSVTEGQKPARWQTRRNNRCCLGFEVAVEVMIVAGASSNCRSSSDSSTSWGVRRSVSWAAGLEGSGKFDV